MAKKPTREELRAQLAKLTEQLNDTQESKAEETMERQSSTGKVHLSDESSKDESHHALVREMQTEIKGLREELKRVDRLESIVSENERAHQRPGAGSDGASLGMSYRDIADVLLKHEYYEAWKREAEHPHAAMAPIKMPSFWRALSPAALMGGGKREYDASTVNIGQFFDTMKYFELATRMPILRTLVPVYDLPDAHKTKGVEYDEETAEHMFYSQLAAAASEDDATVSIKYAHRLATHTDFNKIRIAGVTYTIGSKTLTDAETGTYTIGITPVLAADAAEGVAVIGYNDTPGMYDGAEGQSGSRYQQEWQTTQVNSTKIPAFITATIERLQIREWMERVIRQRFPDMLRREEEKRCWYGPAGVSGKFAGLMNDTRIALSTRSALGAGKTAIDALLYMINEVNKRDHMADTALISCDTWYELATDKGADKHYILTEVKINGRLTLWEVPVSQARILQDNDAFVGDLMGSVELYTNQDSEVTIGTIDKQLIDGKRTMVMSEWLAMAVTRTRGVQRGDLTPA